MIGRSLIAGLACLLATVACSGSSSSGPTTVPSATLAPATADTTTERILELGREVAGLIADIDAVALWDRMDDAMKMDLGSSDTLAANLGSVADSYGVQGAALSEEVVKDGDATVYQATYRYGDSGAVEMFAAFGPDERIAGLSLIPKTPAESAYMGYETVTQLQIPFRGEWFVFWGGRTQEQNYHVISRDQRFAYDFVINVDGSTHTGGGKRNEDYYCFDEPLLAPGPGTVIEIIDGLPDNLPGERDPSRPTGNTVVIEHGNGEFSVMAHFKMGSIAVAVGDDVAAGQEVGRCGNSGNSSEPHLHYHLQDGPTILDAAGLPAFFNDYIADGEAVPRGEPLRGQTIHAE